MIERTKFNDCIEIISKIATAHPKTDDFQKSVAKLVGTRDCFEVKVMFVGHFNAGKSALLNRLIEKTDFLAEAQSPQTAIATELKYDEKESFWAYMIGDNGVKCVQMKTHTDFTLNQCDHIEYRLPSENLKALADFTIVDTPGFDSGVEQHTKALNAYIGQGSAYLLVMDIEDGELTQTSLKFLDEISLYSPRIAIVLNKCDKGIASNNQAIRDKVEETLRDHGFQCPVIATSKFDSDATKKIISTIDTFNAQDAFDEQLQRRIVDESISIRNILQITLDGLFMDTYDADQKIKKLETTKRFVQESFEKQRKKFEEESTHQTQDIVDEIRTELLGKSTAIANALIIGGASALEPIIVETIRPVVIDALRRTADGQLEAIIKTVDFSSVLNKEDSASLGEIITHTAKEIKSMIDNGTFTKAVTSLLPRDDDQQKDGKDKNDNSGKNIYRIVTGIAAIATDIIAPWMEVVIILLPDIINLCSKLFGESQLDKARKAFETTILPQITSRLYAPIDEAVQNSQTVLLDTMTKTAMQKLEALQASIQEVKNAKLEKIGKFEEYKASLQSQIDSLNELITKFQE